MLGMLRAARGKLFSISVPSTIRALSRPSFASCARSSLGLGVLGGDRVEHHDAAILRLGGQRVPQRERAHFLGQIDGVAARSRAERAPAAAEQVDARRAVTGATGALLLVHFLAGTADLGAVLDVVRAALAFGKLPDDATLDEVLSRRQPENCVRQRDRAGAFAGRGL